MKKIKLLLESICNLFKSIGKFFIEFADGFIVMTFWFLCIFLKLDLATAIIALLFLVFLQVVSGLKGLREFKKFAKEMNEITDGIIDIYKETLKNTQNKVIDTIKERDNFAAKAKYYQEKSIKLERQLALQKKK